MIEKELSLRILGWDVESFLRVKVARIRPDGNVLEISGRNGQGKSSAIDSLWAALGGIIPPDPINGDAEESSITVDIGGASGQKYRVRRKIRRAENEKGYGTSVTIELEDKTKVAKPQTILDGLIGPLSVDPLRFIEMKPAEQFDALKQFVPGVDFSAIAKLNAADYEARTSANRRAKEARVRADAVEIGDLANAVTMDEDALVADLANSAGANAKVEQFRAAQAQRAAQADGLDHRAAQNRATAVEVGKEIARLRKVMADAIAAADADEEAASSLRLDISDAGEGPKRVDTTELQSKISEARQHNAKVSAASLAVAERDRLNNEALDLERQSAALTAAMEKRETEKEKAIAAAKMPVEGLTFGDGIILLNGHPLETASQAQKLNIAIAVAAAAQPKLRFVTTKNAALLDKDSWQALVDIAERMDLLIIAETVDSDRPSAVVIEDGAVKPQKAK